MCHPRIDGLFVANTAMVRYEQRILDTTVFALADRPGAGAFVGGRDGLAGPMVGINPSSSHKARKMQRAAGRNMSRHADTYTFRHILCSSYSPCPLTVCAAIDVLVDDGAADADDRQAIVGRVPVKPPVELRYDRSLVRCGRRVGSHYTSIAITVTSRFDAADGKPWGLGVSVYLPKQSVRYSLSLTAAQVRVIRHCCCYRRHHSSHSPCVQFGRLSDLSPCSPCVLGVRVA